MKSQIENNFYYDIPNSRNYNTWPSTTNDQILSIEERAHTLCLAINFKNNVNERLCIIFDPMNHAGRIVKHTDNKIKYDIEFLINKTPRGFIEDGCSPDDINIMGDMSLLTSSILDSTFKHLMIYTTSIFRNGSFNGRYTLFGETAQPTR